MRYEKKRRSVQSQVRTRGMDTGSPGARELLFIDDEEGILAALRRVFLDEDYSIRIALNGKDALAILEREHVDLVIADYKMPDMNGIELLKEIGELRPDIIRIMLTGSADIRIIIDAINDGVAYKFITKPWNDDDLRLTVRLALKHKALLDEKRRIESERECYRSHLDAIFNSMEDGIVTVDGSMRVIEANESARHLCGISARNLLGDKVMTGCAGRCLKVLEEALIKQRQVQEYRIECDHVHRPHQVVVLNISPLRVKDGRFMGAVMVVRDITRLAHLEQELQERHQFHTIIGSSEKMQEIYNLIEKLKDIDTTVLITGQSGTGKELIANAIHYNGTRAHMPFVVVNCSALSENLLESELFGHVKGSFTGAIKDKVGRFQLAEGGTIFLDEIGDISPNIQLKLLRVLENKVIERVGDTTPIRLDVQVISATNADLRKKVKKGEFREDLFYRLKVVEIHLADLKERRDDIPLLVNHYLSVFRKRLHKEIIDISPGVKRLFMDYPWPGNVRELIHALEHAFIVCGASIIDIEDLPSEIRMSTYADLMQGKRSPKGREEIVEILRKTGWNKARAAKILGMGRQTIYRKMKELGIDISETGM